MCERYILEDQLTFEGGAGADERHPMFVYKHKKADLRVVVCQVPSPICCMAMCVPTLATDHKGMPHALEHMVFCGSEKYPYRGYIDAVASHNLGQPMNATTFNDMTVFKYMSLSQEGVANILPVALDHIMHPLIKDSHFATEVYHIDKDGKQQGVVLSEMSDFAYKEGSVRSLSLRQMLYAQTSTYAWESGGLPQSIETLTKEEVKRYHETYYSYSSMSIFLIGAFDKYPTQIFDALEGVDAEIASSPSPLRSQLSSQLARKERRRRDVAFASDKTGTGTLSFAWIGPEIEDAETCIALGMLIDYLQNSPTSSLRQRFVDRTVQIAGDIEFQLRNYVPTMLELAFHEVPLISYVSYASMTAAAATTKHGSMYSNSSYPSPADAFGPLDLTKLRDDANSLFAPNYYRRIVVSTLQYLVDHALSDHWDDFQSYIQKRNNIFSTTYWKKNIDVYDQNSIIQSLSRDIIAFRCSPGSAGKTRPDFSTRASMISIRKALESKSCEFWQSLAKKWFLNNDMVHLAMLPDSKMCIQLEAEKNLTQRYRLEKMTAADLRSIKKKMVEALESTKVYIPDRVLSELPPTPDISKTHSLPFKGYSYNLTIDPLVQTKVPSSVYSNSTSSPKDDKYNSNFSNLVALPSPFGIARVLTTSHETEAKFQISFPLDGLESDVKPYLELFANQMTNSAGLFIPQKMVESLIDLGCFPMLQATDLGLHFISSEEVDSAFSSIFTDYSACIGNYHNGTNCKWPIDVLTIYGTTKKENLHKAFRLILLKLLFSNHTMDNTLALSNKHQKDLGRIKGTGGSLLIDTFPWLRIPGMFDVRSIESGHIENREIHVADEPLWRSLNIYFQSSFLSSVSKSLKGAIAGDDKAIAETHRILNTLYRIRLYFSKCVLGSGLIHLTLPSQRSDTESKECVSYFLDEWYGCVRGWNSLYVLDRQPPSPNEPAILTHKIQSPEDSPPYKRRKTLVRSNKSNNGCDSGDSGNNGKVEIIDHSKYSTLVSRDQCEFVKLGSPFGIHLSMSNIQTSYVGLQVPLHMCIDPIKTYSRVEFERQLQRVPALDFYALRLLTNILTRAEGPVKNAIRGRGHAYGVGIHIRPECGHLAVYISHAVDPYKALNALWSLLEELKTEDGWKKHINEFQLNAAKSIFLFNVFLQQHQFLPLEDALAMLRGFSGIGDQLLWTRKHIESVKMHHLRKVFLKHFAQIVSNKAQVLYIIATPQAADSQDPTDLLTSNPYGIAFKSIPFSMLDPSIVI